MTGDYTSIILYGYFLGVITTLTVVFASKWLENLVNEALKDKESDDK